MVPVYCTASQKNYFCNPFDALVAELVDALDSKSSAERRGGSIPSWGTLNPHGNDTVRVFTFCSWSQSAAVFPVSDLRNIFCTHSMSVSTGR